MPETIIFPEGYAGESDKVSERPVNKEGSAPTLPAVLGAR
jgi:hypothetical protein